jgi:hypothetical protein
LEEKRREKKRKEKKRKEKSGVGLNAEFAEVSAQRSLRRELRFSV